MCHQVWARFTLIARFQSTYVVEFERHPFVFPGRAGGRVWTIPGDTRIKNSMNKRTSLPADRPAPRDSGGLQAATRRSPPATPSRRASSIARRRRSTRRSSSTAAPFRPTLASATARLRLADAYAQNGDGPNALREYVRAAELLPDNEEAQLKAGNFMLMAGQFADARARRRAFARAFAQEC